MNIVAFSPKAIDSTRRSTTESVVASQPQLSTLIHQAPLSIVDRPPASRGVSLLYFAFGCMRLKADA
jgi:hypothetical protein